MAMGEDPNHSLARQAAGHVRILPDVTAVVVIDEIVTDRLAEDEGHGQQQEHADGRDGGVVGAGGRPQFIATRKPTRYASTPPGQICNRHDVSSRFKAAEMFPYKT